MASLCSAFIALLRVASWSDTRRLHLHPARTPHQVELEVDELRRTVLVRLRAHADVAVAQPPLQRAEALPLEPIDRVAGRVGLRNGIPGELLSPALVVALGASEIELPLPPKERCPAGVEERLRPFVVDDLNREPTRLPRDVRGQPEQVPPFVRERRRLLVVGPAQVDTLFEVDRPSARRMSRRLARRDALHADARVAVTVGARASCGARLSVPQRLAVEHLEHARIGDVVVLHGTCLAAYELVAGAALVEWDLHHHDDR